MKLGKCFLVVVIVIFLCGATATTLAKPNPYWPIWNAHPFYLGISMGYGSTDWSQLVAKYYTDIEYFLLSTSAPIAAGDRGFIYGFVTGYEIQPYFAMELNYTRFPNTTVIFDPFSIYTTSYNIISMESATYAYNVVGKFMVAMGRTGIRGFANAGAAFTHRQDALVDATHICPTFGLGVNYVFVRHVMFELGFQYYAGYGAATLRPALNYIPFLYAITAKMAYRF